MKLHTLVASLVSRTYLAVSPSARFDTRAGIAAIDLTKLGKEPARRKSSYRTRGPSAKLAVEKLVDLSRHNYRLEPNVTMTPDNKWVVFRSNLHDTAHVYTAEVAKSE